MADFDPQTYLAQVKANPGPAFDPAQYLSQVVKPPVTPDSADLASHPKQTSKSPDQPSDLQSYLQKGAGMLTSFRGGLVKGATMGYLDPSQIPGVGKGFEEASQENPITNAAGQIGGSLATGAGVGTLVGKVAPVGAGILNALARTGINTGVGAMQGFIQKPEEGQTRLSNAQFGAETGGLVSGALETAGQLARPISSLAGKLGSYLGGLTPKEATAYSKNPGMADQLYKIEKENPLQFEKMAQQESSTAVDRLQSQYINPRKSEITTRGIGKSYEVSPSQFKDTEAYPVLEDAWNKQGKTIDLNVPVSEPYKVQASPVDERVNLSKPQPQNIYSQDPYNTRTADVSDVSRSIVKTGEPITLSEGMIPRGEQSLSIPKPIPDRLSLGTEPLLKAKRAAGQASDIAFKKNPLSVTAADTEAAQRNSRAAVDLGKALEGVDPKISSLNDELSEAIKQKQIVENLGNPSRLFQAGDTPNNVPIRATRQYLDEKTGSDLQDKADSLFAARALNGPMNGFEGTAQQKIKAVLAKGALKGSGASEKIRQDLTNPQTAQALVDGLFELKKR